MFFRGGIVPTFLVVNSIGLVKTRWAVILPAGLSIWNTIVARTYFANLPQELTEASEIDGCSDLRFLAQVVLPLSRPILAVLVLWYAIDHWNTYFNALLYLFDESLFPLHPETLREGSDDRLHQGIAHRESPGLPLPRRSDRLAAL